MLFDGINGRKKARALQTVAIQLIRRNIGGCHQRNTTGKQRLHQTAEQHSVGDVRNKKFVKAQHVRFGLKAVGNDFQRIALPLQGRKLFMDAQHKTMLVLTLFTPARQAMEEQIHQPRFSSPDSAPHIQTTHWRVGR